MTVYELIQELAGYEAGLQVVIDFKPKDFDVTVDSGLTEGDSMNITMEECNGTNLCFNTLSYESHRRLHIEADED